MVRTAYVGFRTAAPVALIVSGKLRLPFDGDGAAVVICHGSDGVDGRGDFYAPALNAAGIATLEIDMWAARGTLRGAAARPGSPIETLPDAFAALAFLAAQPELDGDRVGILGFSWGGVMSLLSTTRRLTAVHGAGRRFAAHAAHYPVCWAYERIPAFSLADRTEAPVLIQTGDADAYDTPGAGERLTAALRAQGCGGDVQVNAHADATHGFDRDLPAQVIKDPFAHEGVGGPVAMTFHAEAASSARRAATAFFSEKLALGAATQPGP